VLARDPQLLQRFISQGFTPGLEPSRTAIGGMHELTGVLLQAFGPTAQP
jgi:hypothetical protein